MWYQVGYISSWVGISYLFLFLWNEFVGILDNECIVGFNVLVFFNVLIKCCYIWENVFDCVYVFFNVNCNSNG